MSEKIIETAAYVYGVTVHEAHLILWFVVEPQDTFRNSNTFINTPTYFLWLFTQYTNEYSVSIF